MKFTISFPSVTINREAIGKAEVVKLLSQEALNTRTRLEQARLGGKGADGQDIKPGGYSPAYIEAIEAGRVKNHGVSKVSTSPVNLTISGNMSRSIQVRNGRDSSSAEIFFNDANTAKQAIGLLSRGFNHWFEFGKTDIERVSKSFSKFVDDKKKNVVVLNNRG